jgi:hypothetical protein
MVALGIPTVEVDARVIVASPFPETRPWSRPETALCVSSVANLKPDSLRCPACSEVQERLARADHVLSSPTSPLGRVDAVTFDGRGQRIDRYAFNLTQHRLRGHIMLITAEPAGWAIPEGSAWKSVRCNVAAYEVKQAVNAWRLSFTGP